MVMYAGKEKTMMVMHAGGEGEGEDKDYSQYQNQHRMTHFFFQSKKQF